MVIIKFILLFSLLFTLQQETFPEKSGGDAPPSFTCYRLQRLPV